MDFTYDLMLCLPANKVQLHWVLNTPGDFLFFEIFWTKQEKEKSIHDKSLNQPAFM